MATNRYPGKCGSCGANVPERQGVLTKEAGRWVTYHVDCDAEPAPSKPKVKLIPTAEQEQAISLYRTGDDLVIEAGAGTGKTSTLNLLAEDDPKATVQYIAFNKAIVAEAGEKFPRNVRANTAHSLAYRAIVAPNRALKARLNGNRQTAREVAEILGVKAVTINGVPQSREFIAARVLETVQRFCQSADLELDRRHAPYIDGIDEPTEDGKRTWKNNDELANNVLLPFARKAWADLQSPDGELRYGHDHYLKAWHLSGPRIDAEVILFDEAQDANPVIAAIVSAQKGAQRIFVGDSQQAIYEFTGAINALAGFDADHRTFLSQSFRFGPAIAEVANTVLSLLDADLRLTGFDAIDSTVGIGEQDDAILCRTNAKAVEVVLELQAQDRKPHLVGDGEQIIAFARAAQDLQQGKRTKHPELACFPDWEAVKDYVANDSNGSDLKLNVSLVERFGAYPIIDALSGLYSEKQADVVVSTAHKAKGREWGSVRLADDFVLVNEETGEGPSAAELRLLYVAVTRAKVRLDWSSVQGQVEYLLGNYDLDGTEGATCGLCDGIHGSVCPLEDHQYTDGTDGVWN